MKFAVIQFLGSNCDMDMLMALRDARFCLRYVACGL